MRLTKVVGAVSLVLLSASTSAQYDPFVHPARWAAYEWPDDDSDDGFQGVAYASSSNCVYFAPYRLGAGSSVASKTVVRYFVGGALDDETAWAKCNVGDLIGAKGGYIGAVFDGVRFLYFVPYNYGGFSYHGEVLRHDTLGIFCDENSWAVFDAEGAPLTARGGYNGGVLEGHFLYFAPFNDGTAIHGEVLRYDLNSTFTDPNSWSKFDPGDNGVGSNPGGYGGACELDGFVYFAPSSSSEVLRFDVSGTFDDPASWDVFALTTSGFNGCVSDDTYVYFSPVSGSAVLRYDARESFQNALSWTTYTAAAYGGYQRLIYDDDRYVYFVPNLLQTNVWHGQVLRYDSQSEFLAPESWTKYEYRLDCQDCIKPAGYFDATFDGRFIYFGPAYNGNWHGEVLRYDTRTGVQTPAASVWGLVLMALFLCLAATVLAANLGYGQDLILTSH